MIRAIAAMSLNRVIGDKGDIPWRIPEDMEFFKEMTSQNPSACLVMGRTTFDSVGPLKNRKIYVLTENKSLFQKGTRNNSYSYVTGEQFSYISDQYEDIWICGGANVYKQFLPICGEVYLTLIKSEFFGDTYMPEFEDKFTSFEVIKSGNSFEMRRYYK